MTNFPLICPVCGERRIFKERFNLEKGRGSYILCPKCNIGVLYPTLKAGKIVNIYKTPRYFDLLSKPVNNPFFQWILTRRIYETPVEWVLKTFSKKTRVLDVGCGNGEYLEGLKKIGGDTWGSDISGEAVVRTRKLLKINPKKIKKGKFNKQKFDIKFDLISFWHILEHLDNPFEYIKKAKRLLTSDGKIVGEMPNFDSLAFDIFKKNYAWVMVPDHILYFNRRSLRKLFKRVGLNRINFYFPDRGLLNFSISLKNYLIHNKIPNFLYLPIFIISIPFSILFIVIASSIGRGEVIRFVVER
jgi:2-polyprenyl-3-methyl-5-hydroxy-6-metoxy-1,4-benzoquinol methylase